MEIPEAFIAGLAAHPEALARFHALPPSHRKEYLKYYLEANKEETRERRIRKILQMLSAT